MASQHHQLKSAEYDNLSNRKGSKDVERSGYDNDGDPKRGQNPETSNNHMNISNMNHSVGGPPPPEGTDGKSIEQSNMDQNADETANLLDQHPIYKRAPWKIQMEKFLNRMIVVIFMSLLTIYTLFLDDVRVLTCPIWSD